MTTDEIVRALDRAEDYEGLRAFARTAAFDPQIAFLLFQMQSRGRHRSVAILAATLTERGLFNPTIDLSRAVAGVMLGDEAEEARGAERLIRSVRTMNPALIEALWPQTVDAVMQPARAAAGDDALHARLDRVERAAQPVPSGAAPAADGFPWHERAEFWAPLIDELDRWRPAGQAATFWWRDDDALEATPELATLLALAGQRPLSLAAISGGIQDSLVAALQAYPQVTVLQHGWTHADHGETEYPESRPADEVRREFADGRANLLALFGERALPVFVPPWMAIAPQFLPLLEEAGFRWMSMEGPRRFHETSGGLRRGNVHVEMLDWFDPPATVAKLCAHLSARRTGQAAPDEATGILTHHKMQDPQSLRYLAKLLAVIDAHPAPRWLHGAEVFPA